MGHVRVTVGTNAYAISEGRRQRTRHRRTSEGSINMDLKEKRWTELAQNRSP